MRLLPFAALLLASCYAPPPDVTPEPPRELSQVAAFCVAHWGADPAATCANDGDCGEGWCMTTCSVFHHVEPVGRCAPKKARGAWCDHVDGDRECASGVCASTDTGDACE